MSAEKHAWRLKRREVANHDDIRYLGPLSYRAFEILGWLCVILSVAVVILTIVMSLTAKPGAEYLKFAEGYILSENNSCKREASRIVGNMAADYPGELEGAVEALLKNTRDEGTVVRWGSAYALARIIVLEPYKNSALVQTVREIYEAEKENGVKNQYKKALKHIKAI